MKDQLTQEMRKRQQYISKSVRTGDEIRDLRNILDSSLNVVSRDPALDPLLLEHESRKLDESLGYGVSFKESPTRLSPRRRSPVRSSSPIRLNRVTSTPSGRSPPLRSVGNSPIGRSRRK